ncbi:carboxypeptidase regulatory-like domain-containing protein [Emticicia sp. BO119]|uniref:carboxypeptidase regulatory-like domain-containing protein n=1 Tax=Emticicia sp. BO119 TaxID=2757768 RepID=UPI0015EFDC40|nr:carboxypeptidase regulatory-like domain-containing protein [Emticicia sp. BO119]MBA4852157.1 OmpA family protein [Emticicia sp. BO119]
MIKIRIGLLAFAFLIVQHTFAQSNKLKIANRSFDNISYIEAIRNYEDYLRAAKRGTPEVKEALTKLAYSYRKVQDSRNAELTYAELLEAYGNDVESEIYLYYAQALANNGKYKESQKMYSKYGQEQTADMRGRKFTVAYMDNSRFFEDSSTYKIDYLYALNSRQSDFSPMFYKNALVFVSAREEGGIIKRVFMQNQTPFLDLFVFPDTTQLRKDNIAMKKAGVGAISTSNNVLGTLDKAEDDEKEEKPLTKVEQFSKTLNSKYHEGPATFFKDYKKIIFTSNNRSKGKNRVGSDGITKLKLYMASETNRGWGNIVDLPFNSNEYSCGHPALSPDDTKLYFVSDMPGGFGGTDIYVSEYRDGQWSSPVNLGREINTEGNEMFPFIDENGDMYFASDGHEGLGGLDIFYVELREGIAMSEVKNLGAPINSSKDDFGLITDAGRSRGYFSSNRKRGYNDDNLYSFAHGCRQLNVLVYDNDTKKPIESVDVRLLKDGLNKELLVTGPDGKVSICLEAGTDFEFKAKKEGYEPNSITYGTFATSLKNRTSITMYLQKAKTPPPIIKGTIVAEVTRIPIEGATVTLENEKDGSIESVVTGVDGKYEFQPKKEGDYSVTAIKDKYAVNTENLGKVKPTRKGPKTVEQNLGLVSEGDIFRLENIYYNYGQFFIRPDAAKELEAKLVPLLKKYPEMRIEIRSHTDSRSSDTFNMKLSENRARAVVDYLVTRGIEIARIEAKGYGESELLNNCENGVNCSEAQHQANRRTEFKILSVAVSSR